MVTAEPLTYLSLSFAHHGAGTFSPETMRRSPLERPSFQSRKLALSGQSEGHLADLSTEWSG